MQFTHPTPVQEEVLPFALGYKGNESSEDDENEQKSSNVNEFSQRKHTKKGKNAKQRSNSSKKATSAVEDGNKDYIVSAETGSGKTLVFALPLLNNLLHELQKANNITYDANDKTTKKQNNRSDNDDYNNKAEQRTGE